MLDKPLLDMIMAYAFFSGIILIPLALVSALYDTFKLRLNPDTETEEEKSDFQLGKPNPHLKKQSAAVQTVQTEKAPRQHIEIKPQTEEPWTYNPDDPDFLKEIRQSPQVETEQVEIPITNGKAETKAEPTTEETKAKTKKKKPVPATQKGADEIFNWDEYERTNAKDPEAFQVETYPEPKFTKDNVKVAHLVKQKIWVKKKKGIEEESDIDRFL